MKKLILTALDDNDDIWFDCFIPFILTLKQTNYLGDIGVINYGLSENKLRVLVNQGISIFQPQLIYADLSLDRFISTAEISQQYDVVALYDADIWFPTKELTVFEQVLTQEHLYCSFDVIHPPFVLTNVNNNLKKSISAKFEHLISKQKYYWQAGLTIASKYAWAEYSHFIQKEMDSKNYFLGYCIDTTLLNLYSANTNLISHLPEKYNCLPFWGVRLDDLNKNSPISFMLNNELIEGLHITRYHRETYDFAFHKIGLEFYLKKGYIFNPNLSPLNHYTNCNELFNSLYQSCLMHWFDVKEIYTNSLRLSLGDGYSYNKNTIILDTKDTFEIKLICKAEQGCCINVGFQPLINTIKPIKVYLFANKKYIELKENYIQPLKLSCGDELLLQSKHLRSDFGVRFLLSNTEIS